MPLVKVWNDNVHPHTEKYKGDMITIPAGGFVEMEWEEGIQFKGQFTGLAPIVPETGQPDARKFKMIRVDAPATPIFKDAPLVNHATGELAASQAELNAIVKAFRAANPERAVADDGSGKTDQIAAMQAQIDELKALIVAQAPRPVGRPKKEA